MKDKQTCFITLYGGMFRRNHSFLNKVKMNAINTALFIQAKPFAFFVWHWNSCGLIRGQGNKSTTRWNTVLRCRKKLMLAKWGISVQSLIARVQWKFYGNFVDKVLREFCRCTFKKTDRDKVMNITDTSDNNKTAQNEWYVHDNSSRMFRQDVVNDVGTKISHWPWVAHGGAYRVRTRLQSDNCARVEPLVKSDKIYAQNKLTAR